MSSQVIHKDGSILAHPFEARGLGIAPFHFIGMHEKKYQACPGAPVQPGGSCQYCGMAILYCFEIESTDGKRFIVGSDCVMKTDTGRLKVMVESKVRQVKNQKAKEARAAKIIELTPAWEAACNTLDIFPHPNAYYALQGNTLGGYYRFIGKSLDYMKRAIKDVTPERMDYLKLINKNH